MRKSDPKRIGEIIDNLKHTTELGEQLERAQIWERWAELAGPRMSARGAPRDLRDGTLYVAAESSVWMHRFAYRKWDIVRRINRMAGRELVSDLYVFLQGEEVDDGPRRTPRTRRKS